ncbi:e1-E2 ATPase domain-containing protein [Sarocladium implicatum]|nr:e1-E2 ATPase domain-containing protein [Sarocladium implicatum]
MGRDCCGSPTEAASVGETSNCKDSCCGGGDGDDGPCTIKVPGEAEPDLEELDACCSSGECIDEDARHQDDTPDCCRGKSNPCCDMSCLDRLAMRECERSAATGLGLKAQEAPQSSSSASACSGADNGKACGQHTTSALDRYGATLQALGCICRALIALGQETCCDIRDRHSLDGGRSSKSSPARPLRRSMSSRGSSASVTHDQAAQNRIRLCNSSGKSVKSNKSSKGKPVEDVPLKGKSSESFSDGKACKEPFPKTSCAGLCCSATNATGEAAADVKLPASCCAEDSVLTKRDRPSSCCAGKQYVNDEGNIGTSANSCGSKIKSVVELLPRDCAGPCGTSNHGLSKNIINASSADDCCKRSELVTVEAANTSCADACCVKKRPVSSKGSCADACCSPDMRPEIYEAPTHDIADVEKQYDGKEHVVLSISGMTCTGCETKLNRTLATVPAVKGLKTSLVLSRAEFTIDLRLGSVEEVVKHLERTTEFKCERVQNQGATLDLIISDVPGTFLGQKWPKGVIEMTLVDSQTVRVAFDPKTVGARDLAEKTWGSQVKLAPPQGDPSLKAGSKHVRHVGYMTLLSAALTVPVLVMSWAPLPERELAYSSASLALATIVQFVIAGPFYPKALKALVFSRVIEMDLLIVLSTSAAYIFSVVSFGYFVTGEPLSTGQFFETSTLLVTLIMVGRWIAALARQRAVESISIRSLQTSTAILVDNESGTDREIDARLLQYGDIFKVLPDTRIPTDGTVITGSSEVDESMLTGESRPVEKYPKSVVIAGSINGPGVMTVRLNRLPGDNTIHAIAAMVDEAKLSKPKIQDLADQVASYFVPVVVALTVITFVIWVAVGMRVRGHGGSEATIQAITYAITVLIVSCPCAIGLAVPMVIVIASGVAAERGIIFKSADAIEVAHKTSHVVFDKTGTLTRGKLSVVEIECIDEEALPSLLGLVDDSRHPVSVAVAAYLKDIGIPSSAVPEPKSLTGKGVETTLGGQTLRAGNSRWLNLSDHELVQPMLVHGRTVLCFTIDGELKVVFGLEDELRSDAAETVRTLQDRGVSVHVVSGDDDGAVRTLASKLGIPDDNVRSRSSPADKKNYIQTLLGKTSERKKPVVVFCGDGTNDAVALAQATIGVHMNEGTDVAQSAADVVLMRPLLAGILTMMNASRKSVNRIKFNFAWSFVYNTFAVLLAAGAFVNARIPPEFAGLGELVSVLPVIAAAVLLRWSKM